jgi:tetratricopeptide (TPR) repeat protein
VALSQLIKGYLCAEVLEGLGQKVDENALQEEAKRIDRNTQAPEMLEKICKIYGRDQEAYLRTFVRLVYSERILYHEIFLKSRSIHQRQYQEALELLEQALRSPPSFRDVAQRKGLEVTKLRVSWKAGIRPYSEKEEMAKFSSNWGQDDTQRLMEAATRIRPGQIYPKIMEGRKGYQVLRLRGREGEDWIIDSVSIPKRNYDQWFWEQASRIPVKIHDRALKEELVRQVAWASKLRLDD